MRLRIVVLGIVLVLAACSTSKEAMDANRQQWTHSGLVTAPPPDAGNPCGTYFVKTSTPEGGRWARMRWHVNGHYSERPSPGVCR